MRKDKKILIVEDEVIVAEDLKRTLEGAGYEVPAMARSGLEAIDMARETAPHMILMDIVLDDKEYDGIDIEKRIREELGLPTIFLTALSDRHIVERAMGSKSYGYLLKPVNEKELIICIETALNRRELEEALRLSEERFRSIYESSPIGIALFGAEGGLLHANPACRELFGVGSADGIRGFNLFEYPDMTDERKSSLKTGSTVRYDSLFNFELARTRWIDKTSSNGAIYLDVLITPLSGDRGGAFMGYLAHFQDITSRKVYENTLKELSLIDQLTGLYNRRGFLNLAGQHVSISCRTGQTLTVVFLDLNGLKTVNDTHGHAEGDRMLVQTANVLRKTFRNSDVLARWGGDEFAVLMINAKDGCEVGVDERITESLEDINTEGLLKRPLSLSWGTACFVPGSDTSFEDVITIADGEMYKKKRESG